MAISQVDVTTHNASTTSSLAISRPSGVTAGDVLIAAITSNNSPQTKPSSEWVEFDGITEGTWQVRLYYKVVTGTEPSSYTWTVSNLGPSGGIVQAWRGVDNTTPIDGTTDEAQASNQSEPYTTPGTTVSSAAGKLFHVRGVRRTSAAGVSGAISTDAVGASLHLSKAAPYTGSPYSTVYVIGIASVTAQYTTSGAKSGIAMSYSSTEATNYGATFALKAAGDPSSGGFEAELPKLSAEFEGERVPNSGEVEAELPKLSATASGVHLIPATGGITSSLPRVETEAEGNTPVLAQMNAVISMGDSTVLVGETRQFGEHIILVEKEDRAFRVVDDNSTTGLKPIKRSRVTDA